jgi:hypothetical protein
VTEPVVPIVERIDSAITGPLPDLSALAPEPPAASAPEIPASESSAPAPAVRARAGWVAHLGSAVLAAGIGGGLAYAFHVSGRATLLAAAIMQALFILSWVFGTGLPGKLGALATGVLAAGAGDAIVYRWPRDELGTLVAVLGLALPVMFVHQLIRGRRRTRVVESLSDIAVLVVGAVALAVLVQFRHETLGAAIGITVALCAGAALAAGHVVDAIWAPVRFDPAVSRGVPALVVSIAAGGVVGYVRLHALAQFGEYRAVGLGASVAAITALFAVGAAFIETASTLPTAWAARPLRPLFGTLFSFALMAPVAYLLSLVIVR